MLELGKLMAESMNRDFEFVRLDNTEDILARDYHKCLLNVRELSALLKSRIEQFNQICQRSYVFGEFEESILHEIQNEGCIELARKVITLKSKYQKLYRQLDQYRISVMKRDLVEGRESNDDIKQWWLNRY
jgi:hypothetical protein